MNSTEKPLRCVVIEDEEPARTWLCDRLKEFEEVDLVGSAESVNAAYRLIVQTKPNGIFLDIKLIGGDAFQLLQQLKDNNVPIPPIIMTTAFEEYAPETINRWGNHVKRYLQKPFVENWETKLRDSINALLATNETSSAAPSASADFLFIKDGNSLHRINFNDLLWIEVAGGGAVFLITERLRVKWDSTLAKTLEQLPPHFQQISRDHAVNLNKVVRVDKEDRGVFLLYQDEDKFLGVGDAFYKELLQSLGVGK